MKGSRSIITIVGLIVIALFLALVFLVLPDEYHTGSTALIGLGATIFGALLVVGSAAYAAGMDPDRGDMPAWIVAPTIGFVYMIIALVVFACTPVLSSTAAGGIHIVLLIGLVLVGGGFGVAAKHIKEDEAADRAAESGYQTMLLAANAAERAFSGNAAKGEMDDVQEAFHAVQEAIKYGDRGGVEETLALENDVATGLRGLEASLAEGGADQGEEIASTLRALGRKVAERADVLKMKK
jgi:hypothetical protein